MPFIPSTASPASAFVPDPRSGWPGVEEAAVDYSITIPAWQASGRSVLYLPHPYHFQSGRGHVQLWAWDAGTEDWAALPTVERQRITSHPTGRTLVEPYGTGPEYGGETPVGCPTDWCNTVLFGVTTEADIKLSWREIVIPALPPEPTYVQAQYDKWGSSPFQYPGPGVTVSISPSLRVNLPELPAPYVWEVWRKRGKKERSGKFTGRATGTVAVPENYGGHSIEWSSRKGAYALFARLPEGATYWELSPVSHNVYRWRVFNPVTGGRSKLSVTGVVRQSFKVRVFHGR